MSDPAAEDDLNNVCAGDTQVKVRNLMLKIFLGQVLQRKSLNYKMSFLNLVSVGSPID